MAGSGFSAVGACDSVRLGGELWHIVITLLHPVAVAWRGQVTSLILEGVPGLSATSRIPRFPVAPPVLIAPPSLHLHAAGPRTQQITEPVSVLLPLRHDPSVALAAVHAAVAQRNVARLDVVVLDVGCTEATYRALTREYGDDPRVRLLDTACLPTGWSRSSHRCQQLAVGARGRILFFADPAAPLGPYAVAAGASLLRRQRLDLLVLDAGGRRRTGRFAVAADTEAYWRIGGHRAAARDPHPLALLRAMRRARASTGLADGRRIIPAGTRAHADELPLEPRDPYFHRRDNGDSTFGSLSTTARRVLAALRVTGADHLVGIGGAQISQSGQSGESSQSHEGGQSRGSGQRGHGVQGFRSAHDCGQPTAFGESTMCGDGTMYDECDEYDEFGAFGELSELGANTMFPALAQELD